MIRRVLHRLRRSPDPPLPGYYPVAADTQVANLPFLLEHFLGRRRDGVFVEVGAFDGVSWSNTSGLARTGWRGWYVEPVPEHAARCRANYAALPNITVETLAIGSEKGETTITVGGALSTANTAALDEFREVGWSRAAFDNSREVTVPQVTLDEFLSTREVPPIDLLVVDVEGAEPDVFAGFDLARWRPKMLIVELVDTHPDLNANRKVHSDLSNRILEHGYRIPYKDATNTVYVRTDVHDDAYAPTVEATRSRK